MTEVEEKVEIKSKVKPTVGRVVHLWGPGQTVLSVSDTPQAALIVAVRDSGRVNLVAFGATGVPLGRLNIPYSDVPKAGHWTWPAKEK